LTIDKEKKREVCAIERAAVLPNAVFASQEVPCKELPFSRRPAQRCKWLAEIRTELKRCNLVFLDPDNGIGAVKADVAMRGEERDD